MSTKVLGRIATVLAVNAKPLQSGLNLAKGELETFASTVKSRLTSAGTSAERALKGMYTDFQRLERAVKAANSQQLNLKVQNPKAILDVARATERIAKPVGDAQKQFSALSQTVQSALLPVLQSGQKQAENFFDAISRGVKVTERDFANTESRVNRMTEAIRRAAEASQATRGLATGQELRFQNPEFLRSTSRAAQLQQQAAQLSPEAISSRGIVSLIGQQKLAADEAERLRANLERTIITRNGDQQAARRAYTEQIAYLNQVNDRLEEQIRLEAQTGQSALNTREQNALRLERQIADAAMQRQEAEQSALNSREQAALRLERQLSDAARSRQQAEEQAFEAFIRRQQAAKSLEQALGGGINPPTPSESDETARLIARERAARDEERMRPSDLTGNRDPRTRVLGQLGQEVGDLRNRLRGVGETLAGDLGPTVDNLTTRFQNMARQGVGVAAEDARRLAQEVAGINTALNNRQSIAQRFESSFGGAGRAGLSLGVDERSLRAIGGQIEFVQGRLSALGQEARGPVIAALDALRTRANQLFQGGALDTEEGRRELQLLREELVRTLAAAGGDDERRLAEQLNRVGDVARGSFGNAGLAIQQAAFAFEDFFSVTGGLDQRIRAAGNNISQLGFILGGTEGLILGISAAVGSQLVVALINWYNEGRTTEDQTKSLNDALARQKSLVEELAQAFESLGDAIASRAFSEPAQQARRFAKELDDVAKKQKELRESRAADLDPDVNRERANQARLRRELESETSAEARVAKERLIAASAARERAAAAAAAGRSVNVGEVQAGLRSAGAAISRFTFNEQFPAIGRRISESANDATNPLSAAAAIRQAIDSLSPAAQRRDVLGNRTPVAEAAEAEILRLSQLLASLELPLQKALDELTISILRASQAASLEIESAQTDVADAIRRGVPGAALLQQNLDAIAQEMATAQQRLRDAQESDSPDREQQIRLAQRDIDGIRAREDAIAEASRDIRLTSGRGGERTTAALSALQGNERFANEYGGLIARLRAAVDAEMVARLANEKAMQGGTDAEKEAARAAYESAAAVSDMAAAAAEAALAMEQAVGRIRKIGADALSQSERMADEAQQRLNERPTDENRRRRDNAELFLIRDRQRVAEANNALDRRRAELQQSDPNLIDINREREAIKQERKDLEDQAKKTNTTVDPEAAERLANRDAQLAAQSERILSSLTEAQREQLEAIQDEIAARRRNADFMNELERRQNPVGDPIRGLDLLERPGQRAARELNQQLADAEAATRARVAAGLEDEDRRLPLGVGAAEGAERIRSAGNLDEAIQGVIENYDDEIRGLLEGGFNRQDDGDMFGELDLGRNALAAELQTLQETRKRLLVDQMRNAAPTIFGLADSVANAVLQGPSRAALQATDVSTVEGSRELTRLLRGDDAARDQANLVELQREANRLLDIIANAPAPVAN